VYNRETYRFITMVLNMRQIINLSRRNIKIINQTDMGDSITVNARARGVQDSWLGGKNRPLEISWESDV
jgi:hypothetical protein